MSTSHNEVRPRMVTEGDTRNTGGRSTLILGQCAPSTSVEREALRRFTDAYAVLVVGKATRRHVFFNLPAAERAVDRAHSRGDDAVLVLVRLVPVAGTVPELRTMGGTS